MRAAAPLAAVGSLEIGLSSEHPAKAPSDLVHLEPTSAPCALCCVPRAVSDYFLLLLGECCPAERVQLSWGHVLVCSNL